MNKISKDADAHTVYGSGDNQGRRGDGSSPAYWAVTPAKGNAYREHDAQGAAAPEQGQ
ncbi:hypothetical protein AB0I77_29070 [Streptomyces sp. NPDC050619]|uniref:hypothetical protein n=1 Tax=Streptomyces sp. NPDC050619 TaxID=3157214 RepID=UPI0034480740